MKTDRSVFSSLIGNDVLKGLLADDLAEDRSAHAYILEGAPGSGRHLAASLICASAVCENRADRRTPLPCGKCQSCRKVLTGISVDVLTISNEDKATIGVEAVRQIKQSLYVTPNDGEKKFYIIENAHRMTVQAQNALLLSLEEPPPYVMFILLCEDVSLLLETIRSRAPVIRMERFSPDFLEEYLIGRYGAGCDRSKAVRAAHLADGAIGNACRLYENGEDEMKLYSAAEELVRLLLSARKSEAAAEIPKILPKDRKSTAEVLSLARFALRDIIADKKGGSLLFYSSSEGTPVYAKKTSAARILGLIGLLEKAETDISANVSQTTVITSLIMKS
ncbi:MAG: hypothetical protein IKI93_18025 [Clostridia bacterium]|nr:hypothetical protein [Clostridia bacterium]